MTRLVRCKRVLVSRDESRKRGGNREMGREMLVAHSGGSGKK
jgi:hypothetical protein